MIIIILIHFLLVITNINGEVCTTQNPFRLVSGECVPFEKICYKENDLQCEQLKLACKNCPPSNITLTILKNIHNINENQFKLIIDDKKYSIETNKVVREVKIIVSISIVINIMLILLISGIICWVKKKYKKFGFYKSYRGKTNTDNADQNLLMDDIYASLQKIQKQLQNKSTDITICTIQFQFDGIDQEPIELYVHNNHNIVQVKQQICAKLPLAKHEDYKIMKLKYNGIILNDDNQYLLEYIDKSNKIVNCFIDSSMNASDILVVNLHGKMSFPDIIQISKNQTVDQLKELIRKIINSKDFLLFKQSNESIKTEELKDNLNNLMDGDWIRIVTKEFGKLIIRSIFDHEDSITIEYVNVDLVSSLMKSISNKNSWNLNNFVLFYNNKCLESEKYIFEYQISSESAVKYCCFMKWADIKMNDDCIIKGIFSELRYGNYEKSNSKILIKKYEVKSSKSWKDKEFLFKELITFQITKSHRRFIQLLGVYIDDSTLYVVMENMDGGTLKIFLQENYDKIDKNIIYKWSAQILVGLKFLHENKVIHRDLNPSSILVDGNNDLKLSSFNLSKYLDISNPSSIMVKRDKKEEVPTSVREPLNSDKYKGFPVRYMAPEILNSEKYGEACDVWSFGAVLLRIVTNKRPYSKLTRSEILDQISNTKMIEYKLDDKYSEFYSIIDSCLKYNPSTRESIKRLMTNKNIQNYL